MTEDTGYQQVYRINATILNTPGTEKIMSTPDKTSTAPTHIRILKFIVPLGLLLFMATALALPYFYETQTLWYKVGWDKVMLRASHLAGMFTLVLIFVQITLALRGKILKDLYGPANLLRWHRLNGLAILFTATLHVLLVLAPEGMANLPIGRKYWPEMVGGLLFFIIAFMTISSHFRTALKLDYARWRAIHKVLGYLAGILLTIHVMFVSESFEQGAPRVALLTLFCMLSLGGILVKYGKKS